MDEPIRKRPQIGEYVHVGDLPGTFEVLDHDGATYRLLSEHGTVLRAGVLVVKLAERQDERAA